MAELIQDAQGKWKITQLILNVPTECECNPEGLEIPAKYTYKGVEVSLSISNSAQTKQTQWKTKLGTAIRIDDIDRKYYDVTRREDTGWKTYKAYDNFSQSSDVKPFVATIDAKLGKSGFTSGAGSTTLSISSNTSWEITCDKSWVTIPVTAGAGNVRIDGIEVSKNTTLSERTATITITCSTGLKKTLTITQEAFVPNISITAPATISATATLLPYSATSNASVTIKCSGDTMDTKTKTSKKSSFTIPANTSLEPVNFTLSAICTNYPTYTASTTVVQSAAEYVFDANPKSFVDLDNAGETVTVTITNPNNYRWQVIEAFDWLSFSSTGGTGTNLEVTASQNTGTSERNGSFKIKDVGSGRGTIIEITCEQQGTDYVFRANPSAFTYSQEGGTKQLNITNPNNYNWQLVSVPDWITASTTAGSSTATVTLTADVNETTEGKTSSSSFAVKDITNSKTFKLNATQDAGKFSVGKPSNPFAYTGSTETFKITDTVKHNWEITSYPDWLTRISPLTGNSTTTVSMTAGTYENNYMGRYGYVVVVDKSDGDREYKVYVEQFGLCELKLNLKCDFYDELNTGFTNYDKFSFGTLKMSATTKTSSRGLQVNAIIIKDTLHPATQTFSANHNETYTLPNNKTGINFEKFEVTGNAYDNYFECFEFESDPSIAGDAYIKWTGSTGLTPEDAINELNEFFAAMSMGGNFSLRATYNSTVTLKKKDSPGPVPPAEITWYLENMSSSYGLYGEWAASNGGVIDGDLQQSETEGQTTPVPFNLVSFHGAVTGAEDLKTVTFRNRRSGASETMTGQIEAGSIRYNWIGSMEVKKDDIIEVSIN